MSRSYTCLSIADRDKTMDTPDTPHNRLIKKAIEDHDKDMHIDLPEFGLSNFFVAKAVLNPTKSWVSYHLSQFLYANPGLYKGRLVLDMGCGSGIQGIICGINGAEHVDLSDVSTSAVECAKVNVRQYGLEGITNVMHGDLFENVPGKYDFLIFNHPFFPPLEEVDLPAGTKERCKLIEMMIFSRKYLLRGFFEELPNHTRKGSVLIMPYFNVAGNLNDPKNYASKVKCCLETHKIDDNRCIYMMTF
jgi:methylase of polypeptide subunit release factors